MPRGQTRRGPLASLDEAQDVAAELVQHLCHAHYDAPGADWTGRKAAITQALDAVYDVGDDGGTVGPLPDNTIVQIAPVR